MSGQSSDNIAWLHFYARSFAIPFPEYSIMTPGEIQDLATCKGIQNGGLKEKRIFTGNTLPDLR